MNDKKHFQKKARRRAPSRHMRAFQFLETIDFTVRPKKSTLTVTKFNTWLWGAAERSFLYEDEQVRFFKQFKYYPWTFITHPKYLTRWLAYVREGLHRDWVYSGLSTPYRSTVRLKGRWMYRINDLIERPTLGRLPNPINQSAHFRKLFQQGFLAKQADHFFMHKQATQAAWLGKDLFLIRYNVVVADILRYRTWTLRRFLIRPIIMRKLLAQYLMIDTKRIKKVLAKSRLSKKSQLEGLVVSFRYCLASIVSRAFRTLGVRAAFILIKNSYVWVNGNCVANPFHPSYPGDLIQLDIFSLLRPPYSEELYPRFVKTFGRDSGLTVSRRHRLLLVSTLLSTFKNPVLMRPGRVGGPQYRYSKGSFLLYSWGLVAPGLGSWVVRQVVESMGFFFDDMKRQNKMRFSESELVEAEALEKLPRGVLTAPTQNWAYAVLLQKFNFFRSYPVFLAFDRVFKDEETLPIKTGGETWLCRTFVASFDLLKTLRLKPFTLNVLNKYETHQKLLKTKPSAAVTGDWRPQEVAATRHIQRGVIDRVIRAQNLKVLHKTQAAKLRGRRTLPVRRVESSLISDKAIFSVSLISRAPLRPGRKHFLNKTNLRFLLAFQ